MRMVSMAERFVIPDELARAAAGEGREDWLAGLPSLVGRIAADWRIQVGDPFLPGGATAWVDPLLSPGLSMVLDGSRWAAYSPFDDGDDVGDVA
jgi:hypothetical protein